MIIEHKDFKISYFSTEQKEKIETFLSRRGAMRCRTSQRGAARGVAVAALARWLKKQSEVLAVSIVLR